MISIITENDLPIIIEQTAVDINNSNQYMDDIKLLVDLISCEFVQYEHFYSVLYTAYTHELEYHVKRILNVLLANPSDWYRDEKYLNSVDPKIKAKLTDWLQRIYD